MNTTVGLFFLENRIEAAVLPFGERFERLGDGAYPLYFLANNGQVLFGNYEEAYLSGDKDVLGNFYRSVAGGATFSNSGYAVAYIELLDPIQRDIKDKYYQLFDSLSSTPLSRQGRIPLKVCFLDSIQHEVRAALLRFLHMAGFELQGDAGAGAAEYMIGYLLQTGRIMPGRQYGFMESLGSDLILSVLSLGSDGAVDRTASEIYPAYGVDMRIGTIAKFAVDELNRTYHVLTEAELEEEYEAQLPHAREWNSRLIDTRRPYVTVKVELASKTGISEYITLEKKVIEGLTGARSRQVGGFLPRFLEKQGVEPFKVVVFGDSILNSQILEGLSRYGESNLIRLNSDRVLDVLRSMLSATETARSAVESGPTEKPAVSIERVDSAQLKPGDTITMRWGNPAREVVAHYEGKNNYMIVQSKNAKVLRGDRFVCNSLELGRKAELQRVFRTPSNQPLGTYRSSGPLIYLGVRQGA